LLAAVQVAQVHEAVLVVLVVTATLYLVSYQVVIHLLKLLYL
jgi:hypothetical protein